MKLGSKHVNENPKNIPQPPSQKDNVLGRGAQSLFSRDESARKRCDSDKAGEDRSEDFRLRASELLNDLQRTRADFENFRKQVDLQKQQAIEAAKGSTVTTLLPLLDDIDRAIAAYPEQLAPLAKNLATTYKNLNLEKINSAPDTDFNPDFHDAVMVEDGDGEREVIAETLRPGYLYRGSVLRPAMVKVKRI